MVSVTPYLGQDKLGEYQDKLVDLYKADATLHQSIPSSIRSSTEWLLRLVNCYYSNRIEGNPAHPKDLLLTQEKNNEDKPAEVSSEVLELLVHLEAQFKASKADVSGSKVIQRSFIKELHRSFYQSLPEEFHSVKDLAGKQVLDDTGQPLSIKPGEFRELDVKVGRHIPPSHQQVERYMSWIESTYDLTHIYGLTPVSAAAGLHHRLAWVHPFQDGNGRAIRLITDCYMRSAGFGGYGLWSITRGFGRDTTAYYKALAAADKPRQGDIEGRGILSDKGLLTFTQYFIDTALDQVKFFADLLEPSKLSIRIDYYFEMRSKGGLPDTDGEPLPLLKLSARDIYKLLLDKGPMSRSAIGHHLDIGEQTLRPVFKQMDAEGLIKAKPKQDVELMLSPKSVEFLFPQIW